MEEKKEKQKFGEVLVAEGLLTKTQLERVLAEQERRNFDIPFGEICISLKFISRPALQKVLKKQKKLIQLGDLLMNMGLVTHEEMAEALELQEIDIEGRKLGEILIDHGFITESNLISALSHQLGIPMMIPTAGLISPSVLKGVNRAFLSKYNCIPAYREGDSITVIMSDPLSDETLMELEKIYRCKIDPAVAPSEEIQKCLKVVFDDLKLDAAPSEPQKKKSSRRKLEIDGDGGAALHGEEDNISSITNFIIANGVSDGATDIHIEPMENFLRVRYRVDGIMHHKTDLPLRYGAPLVSRLKALSGLDIADSRKHQDGRLGIRVAGRSVDLRVSTYASMNGESVVIRVLANKSQTLDMGMLGISPGNLKLFQKILSIPSGITMVTGPSGSGKTTTLYAALQYMFSMDRKIITVEDPIEYAIDGVVQGQIGEKGGLSYKNFVKSMLRQDPDVIVIGEIRDKESADAVVETSLTGHKVLTSFHTEESTGALMRLFEMGVETFLVTSTVVSVLTQRLARTLCMHCREPYEPSQEVLEAFASINPINLSAYTFFTPAGCVECDNSGFSGRTALSEVLVVNNHIRDAILKKAPTGVIREAARATTNMISLQEDGFYKATKGITSLEEVLRLVTCHESDTKRALSSEQIVSMSEGGSKSYSSSKRGGSTSIYSAAARGGSSSVYS